MARKVDGFDGKADTGDVFVRLYGTAAITKGNFVMIDDADTTWGKGRSCKHSDSTTGQNEGYLAGVAVATYTANEAKLGVLVQVKGVYVDANVASSVVKGDRLIASTTAGRATEATGVGSEEDFTKAAVAFSDAASNKADVILHDPLGLSK